MEGEEREQQRKQQKPDSWYLWTKIYSDRDMRLKLFCRDPGAMTPSTSNTLVVKNIDLNMSPKVIIDLFSKCGKVIDHKFPNVGCNADSKYCFLKYENSLQAKETRQHYNNYVLFGRQLEVAHYDLAQKYCKAECDRNSMDETKANVIGYVRQAQLQAELRAVKLTVKKNCLTRFALNDGEGSGSGSSVSSSSPILPKANDFCLTMAKLDEETAPRDGCGEPEDEEAENGIKKMWKCVDDVGLETVSGFWEWLRAKLTFTGPIHYTHPDISKAIHKLPPLAKREFNWLLGAFRASDNVCFIGPYVCLKEHTYWAKEMCMVARLDYKVPFKEVWEPMHPYDINNERQLIKFVRAMLINFGPLSTTDHRVFLLLSCLNEGMRSSGPASSPDGLRRLLETDSHFIVNKDIYYLAREHEYFLGRIRVSEWRTDDNNGDYTSKFYGGGRKDSGGCGGGTSAGKKYL